MNALDDIRIRARSDEDVTIWEAQRVIDACKGRRRVPQDYREVEIAVGPMISTGTATEDIEGRQAVAIGLCQGRLDFLRYSFAL